MTLAALPRESWTVLHDVRWPGRHRANIDHVVIGPPGVFVIDSKNWSGRIEVTDGVLRQNGRRRETTVTGAADAALAVAGLVSGLRSDIVRGVLCFVGDEPVTGWACDVMLCSTSNVVEMLTSRPPVLNERDGKLLARELEGALAAAAAGSSAVRSNRSRTDAGSTVPSRARSAPRPAARRRGGRSKGSLASSLVGALLGIGALGFALGHPEAIQRFGDAFVKVVVDDPSPSSPAEHPPNGDGKRDGERR